MKKNMFLLLGFLFTQNCISNIPFEKLAAEKGFEIERRNDLIYIRDQKTPREITIHKKHEYYWYDIISEFEEYFSAVRNRLVNGRCTVDFSKPSLHFVNKINKKFYAPSFVQNADEINLYLKWLKIKKGDTVYDLGAYSGIVANAFSKAVGANGKVIALEPDKITFPYLQKNINLHRVKNIVPLNVGLSDRKKEVSFSSEGNMGSFVLESKTSRTGDKISIVRMVGLKDLVDLYGPPNVIKMDIEGEEFNVLDHSEWFLKNYPAKWFIEIHSGPHTKNWKYIQKIFEKNGYEFVVVKKHSSGLMLAFAQPHKRLK